MIDALGWLINILAVIGWLVNIKDRRRAMWIFTISTLLSIAYFVATWQMSFLLRSVLYLGIDAATLWQIYRREPPRQTAA